MKQSWKLFSVFVVATTVCTILAHVAESVFYAWARSGLYSTSIQVLRHATIYLNAFALALCLTAFLYHLCKKLRARLLVSIVLLLAAAYNFGQMNSMYVGGFNMLDEGTVHLGRRQCVQDAGNAFLKYVGTSLDGRISSSVLGKNWPVQAGEAPVDMKFLCFNIAVVDHDLAELPPTTVLLYETSDITAETGDEKHLQTYPRGEYSLVWTAGAKTVKFESATGQYRSLDDNRLCSVIWEPAID